MVAEVDDQPRRRRRRSDEKIDLVGETDRPAQHRFEIAGPDELLHDRCARARAVDPPWPLVGHHALARVQVEAGCRLHAHDDDGCALHVDRLAGPVFLQRLVRVRDLVTRQDILELEDDPVVAFVPADGDAVKESDLAAVRGTLDRRRRGTLERIDPTRAGCRRRCRRRQGVAARWGRGLVGSAAPGGNRQQSRRDEADGDEPKNERSLLTSC